MRKTVEILRLKHEVGLTNRQIARSCGLTHPTVSNYLERAADAGLTWPLPGVMNLSSNGSFPPIEYCSEEIPNFVTYLYVS